MQAIPPGVWMSVPLARGRVRAEDAVAVRAAAEAAQADAAAIIADVAAIAQRDFRSERGEERGGGVNEVLENGVGQKYRPGHWKKC